jgi:malate dehydrogenase (quinone)
MYKKISFLFLVLLSACEKSPIIAPEKTVDIVLIGGGIMSATLGTMLRELEPDFSIEMFEQLPAVGQESSGGWNNAGTGHAGYCELNYTDERDDGSLDLKKAITTNEAFELSKQFWSYLVEHKKIPEAQAFLHKVPHVSFVWGEDNVRFLKKRYEAMRKIPQFSSMEYSEDPQIISSWLPLVMQGRDPVQKCAATRVKEGLDVDFGALTTYLFWALAQSSHTTLNLSHRVTDLKALEDNTWHVQVKNLKDNSQRWLKARFVFIGAGGGSLALLQKSGIQEAKSYGGFPVGGEWLVTKRPDLIARHDAKVYGKAAVGSPPMSVPHLDTRFINGEKALFFGPFATFSTKFLKNGSWTDLFASVNFNNVWTMLVVGIKNIDLTKYLIEQVLLSQEERVALLQEYFPQAESKDWQGMRAGQRVQVIKKDPLKGPVLQFGTEIVSSKDNTLQALLGASPGASIAVDIMLKVLEKSFKEKMASTSWQMCLKKWFK